MWVAVNWYEVVVFFCLTYNFFSPLVYIGVVVLFYPPHFESHLTVLCGKL